MRDVAGRHGVSSSMPLSRGLWQIYSARWPGSVAARMPSLKADSLVRLWTFWGWLLGKDLLWGV